MTKDEIIQMAEDCGISHRYYEIPVSKKGVVTVESCTDRLLKFAELIAEMEREACAKVLDEMADQMVADMEPSTEIAWVRNRAEFIRARGNT